MCARIMERKREGERMQEKTLEGGREEDGTNILIKQCREDFL